MTHPDNDILIDLDNYDDSITKNCNSDNDEKCSDRHQQYCDDEIPAAVIDHENPPMMKINQKTLERFTTTPISSSCSDDTISCGATTLILPPPTKTYPSSILSSSSSLWLTRNFTNKYTSVNKVEILPTKATLLSSGQPSVSNNNFQSNTNTTNNNSCSHDDHVKLTISNNKQKLVLRYTIFVLWILCFILLLSIFILVTMTYRKLNINQKNLIDDGISNPDSNFSSPTISPSLVFSQPTIMITNSTNDNNSNNSNNNTSSNSSISTNNVNTSSCPIYPSPPRFKGKKGAARTLRTIGRPGSWIENLPGVIDMKPYWNYNWDTIRIDAQPYNIEFVPMMWGGSDIIQFDIQDHVVPYIESDIVQRVLGFNEPDAETQSNVTVTRALELWTLLESLNVPIVSPSCWQPKGEWMKEFMNRAKELCRRIDYIGVHWYGGASFEAFKNEMEDIYNMYGKIPLLITEFAPADWTATNVTMNQYSKKDVLQFMKSAIPWLEQQDWIHGYAWFSFAFNDPVGVSSSLFTLDGQLTKCGEYYASISNENIYGNQSITIWENE